MKIGSTIYLKDALDVKATTVLEEIHRLFPNFSMPVRAAAASGADNILISGEIAIAIFAFDMPQSTDDLEPAYKLNFIWPEARDVISTHDGHIMLAVMGDVSGFDEMTAASRLLAVATLALAKITDALAVYWDTSIALMRNDSIAGLIARLKESLPPLDLWVTYSPWVDPKTNEIGLFSFGLKGFVGYEIEMAPRKESLGEVLQRAIALTGYLLEKGPVLRDGNTIGYSETEKLRVKFADDGQGETVLQITTEQVQ
jgi:Domain of unknown function (DUF4261)